MNLFESLATGHDFAIPIVDAHHHLWDLSAGRYPSKQDQYDESFFLGDYRKICRDYMPTDYVGELKGFRVVGSVHIQAGRSTDEQVAETEWLETMHRQFGLPSVAVGHVSCIRSRPTTSPGPTVSVAGAPGTMQDDHWRRNFALLEKHRMSGTCAFPIGIWRTAPRSGDPFPAFPWSSTFRSPASARHSLESSMSCARRWLGNRRRRSGSSSRGMPSAPTACPFVYREIRPARQRTSGSTTMRERLTRRRLATMTGGALATTVVGSGARASDPWPTKPIRVLMPFGAGGSMDVLSRLLAPIVSDSLGQQVIVENRPGATGTVAMASVASAPADGYTLMFTGSSYATVPLLMRNLPFTMDAFTPLSRLTIGPTILTVPSQLGVKTMAEFVAAAKAQPGKWSYGSSGVGTSVHLGGELFKMAAGVDMAHVPYRATPAIVADLLEGRIQMSVLGVTDARQYILSGQLRGLALSHTERMPEFPDLPTFAEVGYPNVRASNDFGVAIRAGTPEPVKAKLEEAYRTAVRRPEIVKRLADIGLIVVATSSAEFVRAVADDTARYAEVIRVANIKLE